MKKETKQKKIQKLVSLVITLIISLVCLTSKVSAECTYNLVEESTKFTLSSGTSTGVSNNYYSSSATYFSGYETIFSIDSNSNDCHGIYPGQYLMDFYVYSESDFNNELTISNFSSNFKNINITTGNLVANEIASQLVDFYQTTYNGKNAYRLLYKFTFDGDYANEFDFSIKTSPNYFFNSSSGIGGYGISYSNMQNYNISIIDSFNSDKLKQKELDKLDSVENAINNNFTSCGESSNLYVNIGVTKDKVINGSGEIIESKDFAYSDFIKVDPNKKYNISWNNNNNNIDTLMRVAFYDSNKNFIERPFGETPYSFTTTSKTYYIRLSYYYLYFSNIKLTTQVCQNKLDQQLQQDKEQHDEFMDSDISDKDKELPDDSKYQDYSDTENSLKDKVNQADMSVISIGIDGNSSSWVWDTLTRLIQSNSIIFGMFISILSIGIIKLALGR